MNVTFEAIEDGAKAKVNQWISEKGRVLYVWADNLSGDSMGMWTYYVVATVPTGFDPSLQFLRVFNTTGGEWVLSQDESLNLAVVFEEAQEA